MDDKTQILNDLASYLSKHDFWASVDFITTQTLFWLALVSSFVAGIGAALGKLSKGQLGIIAAIPGFVILVDKTFNFNQRSEWHEEFSNKVRAVERSVHYASLPAKDASDKLSVIEGEMKDKFPKMTLSGVSPVTNPPITPASSVPQSTAPAPVQK